MNQYLNIKVEPIRVDDGDILDRAEFEKAMKLIEQVATQEGQKRVYIKPENGEPFIVISCPFDSIRQRITESGVSNKAKRVQISVRTIKKINGEHYGNIIDFKEV